MMKRYFPILLSVILVVVGGYLVVLNKHASNIKMHGIGQFKKGSICAQSPQFLVRRNIKQPVVIDLTQTKYKGVAMHYGKNFSKTLHPKKWENYGYFSTEALDKDGNIYLAPIPFISIDPSTFNLQKNLYRMDSETADISIFKHFDDVYPTSVNPYGINAVVYDCDDDSLWVSAIDEATYEKNHGVIYHLDVKSREILDQISSEDALTLQLIHTTKGKYLLVGSARDNVLYAYSIDLNQKINPHAEKLFELPSVTEHVRGIKVKSDNTLHIESIPFTYSMIAESSGTRRTKYIVTWNHKDSRWIFKK